ncbi:hypothetical protein FSHL1_006297 [Fusarium sambucinum]
MDPWYFPGYTMPPPSNQQPQAYTYGNTPTLDTHVINESALQGVPPVQPTAGQPGAFYLPNPPQEPLVTMHQNTVPLSDAELTETPMGPPPKRRKRKAPTIRAKEWEPYKARILDLHDEQKFSLPKVKTMIEEEFGFTAELRQYRTRITQWGKDKNVKPQEMSAIVRKRQQRKLVEIDKREQSFTVRGRNVEPHKIDRWMSRNDVSQASLYAPSPAASTPSAVGCQTISERDSVVSSPAYSISSLNFSPRDITSIVSSPVAPSPMPSVWEISHSQDTAFTGQSPAPANQLLAAHYSISHTAISNVISDEQLPRRYRQEDEELIREELSLAEDSLGIDHSHTLGLRIHLGYVLQSQGRYKSAEEAARRTIRDCQRHKNMAVDMFDATELLSIIMYSQGSLHESQKLRESLVTSKKAILGEEHQSTLESMERLSYLYMKSEKVEDAKELCARILEIRERTLGGRHHDTTETMIMLSSIHVKQEQWDDAENLASQVFQMRTESFGKMHKDMIDAMYHLAFIYVLQDLDEEAEELYVQVVEYSILLFGKDSPETLNHQGILPIFYRTKGLLDKAEDLEAQLMVARKKLYGEQHPRTLDSMSSMVEIYILQRRFEEAEDLGMQLLVSMKRVLGEQHPDTLEAVGMMERIQRA